MDLAKHNHIFDPLSDVKKPVHLLGCGAVGSHIAVLLARLGICEIHIYDFDIVVPYNITNQEFFAKHIGLPKTEAIAEIMKSINPDIKIHIHEKYEKQILTGYVFLCVDNIETRQAIVEHNMYNNNILAMFDFRMGLYTAQHYATDWSPNSRKAFRSTMEFTHAEAVENVPVSPCGTQLSVAPTVHTIASIGIINFIKICKGEPYEKIIIVDLYKTGMLSL